VVVSRCGDRHGVVLQQGDRLLTDHGLADKVTLTAHQTGTKILGLHVVQAGHALDLCVNLFAGRFDRLGLRDRIHDQRGLHTLLGTLTELLTERLHILTDILKVLLKLDALVAHLVLLLVHHAVDLLVDHHLGDLDGGVLDGRTDGIVLEGRVCAVLRVLFQLGAQAVAVLGQCIELADVTGEIVIGNRKLTDLDRVHLALEYDRFALQLRIVVILGECQVDREVLSGRNADQLLLEAGNERLRSDFQIVTGALAAFKRHIIEESLVIDIGGVAFLHRTIFDRDHAGIALDNPLQVAVNVRFGDRVFRPHGFDTAVGAQGHFRLDRDRHGKTQALFAADGDDVNVRTGDRLESVLLDSLRIRRCGNEIDGVVIQDTFAVIFGDDAHRRLAAAESGHIELIGVLDEGALQRFRELLG